MAKGIEGLGGWQRGAETQIIRTETPIRTPDTLIEKYRGLAHEAMTFSQLTAVLQGEESTPFIAQNRDSQKKLEMAKMLLNQTPFIRKLLPPQFDELEQAALIVGLAEEIEVSKKHMN